VSSSPIVVHALSDSSFPALTIQCGAAKNHIALGTKPSSPAPSDDIWPGETDLICVACSKEVPPFLQIH
jgi:hypothetical protein